MRKLLYVLIFLGSSILAYGQVAMPLTDAVGAGIDMNKLNQLYIPALSPDSAKAAFAGHEKEFIAAYKQMLGDLGVYLSTNNFFWEKETKFVNRIYFNANGQIAYYFYTFKDKDIAIDKEKDFKRLINQFIKTYRFPITCKINFLQSSPVTFLQNTDDNTQRKNAGNK